MTEIKTVFETPGASVVAVTLYWMVLPSYLLFALS